MLELTQARLGFGRSVFGRICDCAKPEYTTHRATTNIRRSFTDIMGPGE